MSPIVTILAADGSTTPIVEAPDNTVGYWLVRLGQALDVQMEESAWYERYYGGQHPLQFATSKFRETFGNLFAEFADNWCQVVVDAAAERMQVQGFRFGKDEAADTDAWDLWQANYLDSDSGMAHTDAIKNGRAFLLVEPGDPPRITPEHPSECVVAYEPGNRRKRIAGLKRWQDDDGFMYATLYLPEGSYRYVSAKQYEPGADLQWTARQVEQVPNVFGGVIPLIPMLNKPSLLLPGISDLVTVVDIQNAVNKLCTDMMVAAEYAAFRQRWATGVEIPVDPETGRPNAARYLSAISRVWSVEESDAKFGDFNVTDLTLYVKAIEMFIQHLAAQTRTPPHYLTAGLGQWPSGDSLRASEAGLVAKVKAKMVHFGEAWEEAMRLAFLARGDKTRAVVTDAEVLWADPEYRTESQHVDALTKLATLHVPDVALWEMAGFTPQQIERWTAYNKANPPAPPPPIPPAPGQAPAPPADVPPPDPSNSGP